MKPYICTYCEAVMSCFSGSKDPAKCTCFLPRIHLCPGLEALAKICYICDFGVATKFLVKITVNSNYIYGKFLLTLSIILDISLGTD